MEPVNRPGLKASRERSVDNEPRKPDIGGACRSRFC